MNPSDKSREHQANERTFLAWIRTCIGIMAFGFVVVKFSLFLKQLALLIGKSEEVPAQGYSGALGIILVAFGWIAALLAYLQYRRIDKQLASGAYSPASVLPVILVGFILVIGVFLMAYLVQSI
jgi:putative membrane protein